MGRRHHRRPSHSNKCKDLSNHICRRFGVTELKQSDFDEGTYRITQPGCYKLVEDIVFEPNPDNDFRPDQINPEYKSHAYVLGFFAAITIETSYVDLDLNGHCIKQSELFAAAQRFFAIIELASAPFIPGQGPGNFGKEIDTAKHSLIHNGTLGRSSHHGIHGNDNEDISIYDLNINDYEVGAIAINSLINGYFYDIKMGPGSQHVPVLGNFSAARFMPQFYELAKYLCENEGIDTCDMNPAPLDDLVAATDEVLQQIKDTGVTTSQLFGNESLLPDGNNYGLMINVKGVAVNDYIEEDYDGKYSKNIYVKKLMICDMKVKVNEIIGISQLDGSGVQNDASGSVIQILEIKNPNNTPKHNVLADAQFYLARYVHEHGLQGKVGKLNIDENLTKWYYGELSWADLMELGYKFKCNGDSMFHVNKGTHGIRMDGVHNVKINDVYLKNLKAVGFMGNEEVGGSYEKSHDQQERYGYRGADITGAHFSYCKNVKVSGIRLCNIHSDNGEARGIRLINQCENFCLNHVKIDDLSAGFSYVEGKWYGRSYNGELAEYTASFPNEVPNAVGIQLDTNSYMELGRRQIKHLSAPGCAVPVWTN